MNRGNFFETLAIGSGAHGKSITDLPRKKNGDKTVAQERIEQQARTFHDVLKAHRMKIRDTQVYIETPYEGNPNLIVNGTLDFTASLWDDTDGPISEAIIDLKLTMNIYSQFGPYCWHFPQNMDHTQAFMYSYLYLQKYGKQVPFYYLVFDYKPTPEYKIIKKMVGPMEYRELHTSIQTTVEKIQHHETRGYFTNPGHDNCSNCPLKDQCVDYSRAKKIQTI